MVITKKELKQGRIAWLIWTIIIGGFLGICILIYPEMKEQMQKVGDVFSNMGEFSMAFGMDQLNFGEFKGFFGVECGNILGMFGAFYAALLGISALAKEEKQQTAEFLLTHPIKRSQVVFEKMFSIIIQITLTNLFVMFFSFFMIGVIGEEIFWNEMLLLFLAYFLMQVEVAMITFAISSFLSKGELGVGLGLAAVFYFMGIFSNLVEELEPIKYITPFGYAESAFILTEGTINLQYLGMGILITIVSIVFAFIYYNKKEIS